MSTHPLMHASSPAVVKTNNTTRTIGTATFDPPARICIVAGITSDADVTTGAAPTINTITGLTWTRVGPNLGFGSGGDVGVVALFAGVLDDPDADLGSISVTVDTNITALKPKMLVVRVYDETQVDIADPIGAIASGQFNASTFWSTDLVPETDEGGARGLWLDWNATGIPTIRRPNNDNTESVDAFHNVSLSTNAQISGQKRTRAGVAHNIGATLLGTSNDGNWLAYELRGPQPAAGPAFDAGAFSSPAFATAGGPASYPRSTSDSTTTADSTARTLQQPRGAADSTSTADTTARTVARPRSAADTTSTSDSTAAAVTRLITRSCSDSTSTSDTTARTGIVYARAAADSTTTADSTARTLQQPRGAADSTSTADTTARTVARPRSAADTTSTSDSTTPATTGQIVRGTSDSTTTADSTTRTLQQPRGAADSTSTADTTGRTVARPRSAADTTSTSDTTSPARTPAPRIRSTSDSVTLSDTTTPATTGQITRSTSDATSTSDQVARRTDRARAAGETTSTSDTSSRTTSRGRVQLETTTLGDLAARAIASSRQQLETTTTVDTCSALLGLPPFEIQIIRVTGRQRLVETAGRSGRTFTATGRPPETPPAGRSRTFSWTGRQRPPITGAP